MTTDRTTPSPARTACSKGCAVWYSWNDGGHVYGAAFCDRGWHVVGPLYQFRKRRIAALNAAERKV